jgi:hypothetical protein
MGLLQLIQSGTKLTRDTLTLTNTPVSGSTSAFGSTYILLDVTVNNPCRIRLYSDSSSVAIDNSRTTSSFTIDDAVGLTLDTLITSQSYTLNFDPPIIGTTFSASTTWYNISGSNVTATFTYYPIEIVDTQRHVLTFQYPSLPTGSYFSDNIVSPKSFLILSASSNYSGSRLRLYSRDVATVTPSELSRPFGTQPGSQVSLISDMVFDSASYAYKLVPILQAYNLESYAIGDNYVGYALENISSATMTDVTASLYIYPIED